MVIDHRLKSTVIGWPFTCCNHYCCWCRRLMLPLPPGPPPPPPPPPLPTTITNYYHHHQYYYSTTNTSTTITTTVKSKDRWFGIAQCPCGENDCNYGKTFHWRAMPQSDTKVDNRELGFRQCHHGQCLGWVHESLKERLSSVTTPSRFTSVTRPMLPISTGVKRHFASA